MSERKKFRIQQALRIERPGLAKPAAMARRNQPPRRALKRKATQVGVPSRETQKLLLHYDLREEQLRRFVRKAQFSQASTGWWEGLIGLLERRLDTIVFRLGFAHSIRAARRLVAQGYILVNSRPQTVGSMILRPGDVIWLTEQASQMEAILSTLRSPRRPMPSYLQLQNPITPGRGVLLTLPEAGHVPFL